MNLIFRFYELALITRGHGWPIWVLNACPLKFLHYAFLCQQIPFQRSQMKINIYTGSCFYYNPFPLFAPVWKGL